MPHNRSAPSFDQDILTPNNGNAKTSASWYRWFQDVDLGVPPSSEVPVTVTASPFTFAPKMKGVVVVSGGTVSLISLARSGTFYPTGQITGTFTLAANDQLMVTYSALPTMIFLPS